MPIEHCQHVLFLIDTHAFQHEDQSIMDIVMNKIISTFRPPTPLEKAKKDHDVVSTYYAPSPPCFKSCVHPITSLYPRDTSLNYNVSGLVASLFKQHRAWVLCEHPHHFYEFCAWGIIICNRSRTGLC
jgi:hypothetical protein